MVFLFGISFLNNENILQITIEFKIEKETDNLNILRTPEKTKN